MGQVHSLFNAAYHTTAYALTWTLFLLAQHPTVMRDLMDELDEVLGGQPPAPEQVGRLELLGRVIDESLRMLPPIVYSPRINVVDLPFGSFDLPAGSLVVASYYITHRLPNIYEHPRRFDPDRWLTIRPSPYEYLPFSTGPRMCIGAYFAGSLLKVSLSMILQRFRLSVVPGTRVDRNCSVSLGPRGALPMTVCEQDRQFAASPVEGHIHEMVELPTTD
jgi:cytochrome P450